MCKHASYIYFLCPLLLCWLVIRLANDIDDCVGYLPDFHKASNIRTIDSSPFWSLHIIFSINEIRLALINIH